MPTKPSAPARAPLQDASQRANQLSVRLPPIRDAILKPGSLGGVLNAEVSHSEARSPPLENPVSEQPPPPKPKPKTKATATASAGRKRKAETTATTTTLEEDIAAYKQDLSHIDVDGMVVDMSCEQVRRLINQVLDRRIMKKGEFCSAIGSSSHSVNTFLQRRGPTGGMCYGAYDNAWAWFKQRELAGLEMPDVKKRQEAAAAGTSAGPATKKSKTSAAAASEAAAPDLSQIHLDGEATDEVPVFDTADEVRRKITVHLLGTPGLTQAQFCRDLYAQLRAPACRAIRPKQLADFRAKRGPRGGCASSVFYAAYVYFERLRIALGRPKSPHRVEMEGIWLGGGFDRENDDRQG